MAGLNNRCLDHQASKHLFVCLSFPNILFFLSFFLSFLPRRLSGTCVPHPITIEYDAVQLEPRLSQTRRSLGGEGAWTLVGFERSRFIKFNLTLNIKLLTDIWLPPHTVDSPGRA